jgi:hypothetical protein
MHVLKDKVPIFASVMLDAETVLPTSGLLRCDTIGAVDEDGVVSIRLLDAELENGVRRFEVLDDDVRPDTRTLWRPVGGNELRLIEQADYRRFPPRLPEQPIFYPVINFAYAEQIARDWNSNDATHANVGFVTEFDVLADFIDQYEPHQVGGLLHQEYWIPADELATFNDAIVGQIRVIAEYRNGERVA